MVLESNRWAVQLPGRDGVKPYLAFGGDGEPILFSNMSHATDFALLLWAHGCLGATPVQVTVRIEVNQ